MTENPAASRKTSRPRRAVAPRPPAAKDAANAAVQLARRLGATKPQLPAPNP